jgi:hypothetical protein
LLVSGACGRSARVVQVLVDDAFVSWTALVTCLCWTSPRPYGVVPRFGNSPDRFAIRSQTECSKGMDEAK